MTKEIRIKNLQRHLNAHALISIDEDGILGKKTVLAFGKFYCLNNIQLIQTWANMHHESGGFTIGRENMTYTTEAQLMKIFGYPNHSAAIKKSEARNYINQPYKLAERVYGIQNKRKAAELGNTLPGDGYKYRGGGALQCTGKGDYIRYGAILKIDLVNNPDLINNEAYFTSAIAEFQFKNIWANMKDLTKVNIEKVRRMINGGLNGIDDVNNLIVVYQKLIK